MKGPWNFYIDFIIYPILGSYLLWQYCDGWNFFGWVLSGFLLFTFVEYWVHRSLLHGPLLHTGHDFHHKHPEAYITFPFYFIPSLVFGAYWILPLAVFTGFIWGLIWFGYWHHVLHHFDLNKFPAFVRHYAKWHLAHHHDHDCNHGITVPFWDWLFRTSRKV